MSKKQQTKVKIVGYPFVSHVNQEYRPEIEIDLIRDNQHGNGEYKLMGYRHDLRPYLKRYVFCQYGDWHCKYAVNRTDLRKKFAGRNITEIYEIPNKFAKP